jgi:hypothetical protein
VERKGEEAEAAAGGEQVVSGVTDIEGVSGREIEDAPARELEATTSTAAPVEEGARGRRPCATAAPRLTAAPHYR